MSHPDLEVIANGIKERREKAGLSQITSWEDLVKAISYKKGFHLEHVYDIDRDQEWLHMSMEVEDTYNPGRMIQVTNRLRLVEFRRGTLESAIHYIMRALMDFEEHEMYENFKIDGHIAFNPHVGDTQ